MTWHDKDGKPDFDIVTGGRTFTFECKNIRSKKAAKKFGEDFEVELQKTRHQLVGGKKMRGYIVSNWDILAVCLFNKT